MKTIFLILILCITPSVGDTISSFDLYKSIGRVIVIEGYLRSNTKSDPIKIVNGDEIIWLVEVSIEVEKVISSDFDNKRKLISTLPKNIYDMKGDLSVLSPASSAKDGKRTIFGELMVGDKPNKINRYIITYLPGMPLKDKPSLIVVAEGDK